MLWVFQYAGCTVAKIPIPAYDFNIGRTARIPKLNQHGRTFAADDVVSYTQFQTTTWEVHIVDFFGGTPQRVGQSNLYFIRTRILKTMSNKLCGIFGTIAHIPADFVFGIVECGGKPLE